MATITAPHPDEQRNDPRALAEGQEAALRLPKGHLAELCRVQKQEAETATSELRARWKEWWELWHGEVTFDGKEDWQSQIWIHKPFAAVEQGVAIIQRSLLDSPEFFGMTGVDEDDKLASAHVLKPLLKLLLNHAKFVPKYSDVIKVGFITGVAGYLKFRWASSRVPHVMGATVDQETGFILPSFSSSRASILAIDYVLPWRIYRDPDSIPRENFSGTYLWHSEWKDRPALQAMIDRGWDREAVMTLLSKSGSTSGNGQTIDQREEAERRQQQWARHKFRKGYLVDEGWVDILNEDGDVVFPNALMIHSEDEILLPPRDNPLWATDLTTGRRKWPFVATSPIMHPARFEGRGILEQDQPLSMLFNNTMNLSNDAMNWIVNPGAEVFQGGLVDWDDLAHYPGKLWVKNVKEQVLSPAQWGKVDLSAVLAYLNFVNQERQNSNFVTDMAVGLPGARSDITKGEVQIKTAQSLAIFEMIGRNLDFGGQVAVELAFDFIAQYMGGNDYISPAVVSILGPHKAMLLAQMPLADRVAHLQGQFDFTFTGVSQALMKEQLIRSLLQFATLAASGPYAGRTNPTQILRMISELLGLNDRIDVFDPAPPPGMVLPGLPGVMGPTGTPMTPLAGPGAGPGAPLPTNQIQNPASMIRSFGAPSGPELG